MLKKKKKKTKPLMQGPKLLERTDSILKKPCSKKTVLEKKRGSVNGEKPCKKIMSR